MSKGTKDTKQKGRRNWWEKILYFFPLQLLFVHLKKNQQLLIFWTFLFLALFQLVGEKYGIPFLFLAPEYLGEVSIWSYAIFGFALGGFAMAFNISSYIMNGFRFPFLATLSKPFLKYCINNSTIPLAYITFFVILSSDFLLKNEGFNREEIVMRELGFLGGYFLFVILSLTYFMMTNTDFEKLFGKDIASVVSSDSKEGSPAKMLLQKKDSEWYQKQLFDKAWRVDSYIGSGFQLKLTRSYAHYDRSMLTQVFRQNHINASFFEVVVISSILLLGLFRENPSFIFPAGATFFLLLTMILMAVSALRSWIRGWTLVVLISLFFTLNYLSKYENYYYVNHLFGLDYSKVVPYPPQEIDDSDVFKMDAEDLQQHKQFLTKWAAKNHQKHGKPKAIFIASSGGGSRAALWSFLSLQHLDSLTHGNLMNHAVMMTGSSGGMIGSSYYRELWHRSKLNDSINPHDAAYRWDMGTDLLNPLLFNLAVNDIFIRTKRYTYDGEEHWKDRGYVFEETLNQISRGVLDKRLADYAESEKEGEMPFMIFTPSIVNDSRRMMVSNLPLSFMSGRPVNSNDREENIEFMRLFKDHKPDSIRFLSLLRMNATFPYIMPLVDMPTEPGIELFDSGLRDNYGIKTTTKYIFHLRDWLRKNTSGIIILQLRNGTQQLKDQEIKKGGIITNLSSPFGSLYGNYFQVQDFNNEELLEYTKEWFQGPVDLINFELHKNKNQKISLSWHLTSREKEMILISLFTNNNQKAAEKLKRLLE